MRARFIGDRDGDGPKEVNFFGHVFVKGEWRSLPDEVREKMEGNWHFEIEPFNGAPVEAFDHDGDGEAGGSKPIRPVSDEHKHVPADYEKPKRGRPRKS